MGRAWLRSSVLVSTVTWVSMNATFAADVVIARKGLR